MGNRILVVDDDSTVREMVALLLTFEGFDVVAAQDGPEAIEVARQTVPDAVLLDVMMPGMHGLDVVGVIRADPDLVDIPVILLTALRGDSDQWRGWAAGVDSYVTKPFDDHVLLGEIERVLAERSAA